MGYTTDFQGEVRIEPPLNEHEISFLADFCDTRHASRHKGPLFVADHGNDYRAPDIIDYNVPHPDKPGLNLDWIPTEDGTAIEWDGCEKFYDSAKWMKYLISKLLAPSSAEYIREHLHEDERLKHFTSDHTVSGEIDAYGEESGDVWRIVVRDNEVFVQDGRITFEDEAAV